MKQFSQEEILRAFYMSGSFIFLIVGIANSITNFVTWENMILSLKVSSIFMNIFNYVIVIFFLFLLRDMKPLKVIEKSEADEIFKEAIK